MKTQNLFLLVAAVGGFFIAANPASAQGTAFTYQGRLNSGGGAATGSYDLTFALFAANTGGVAIAGPVTNSAIVVSNGLFTTTVDFGAGVFTGGSNWLEIAVQTNGGGGFATLAPRQQLTPTPYAITATQLAGVAQNDYVNGANATVSGGYINQATVDYATVGGGEDNLGGGINATVGGGFGNASTGYSATIGGGYFNVSSGQESFIGGGGFNTNSGDLDTVGGGYENNDGASSSFVGGGAYNAIQSGSDFSTIGGGKLNLVQSNAAYSVVIGGIQNVIQVGAGESVIGGGYIDIIQTNANNSTIGGGTDNTILANAQFSTIGGGWHNTDGGSAATTGGGEYNTSSNFASTVGGGYVNNSLGAEATVSGGVGNTSSGDYSIIPGGADNIAAGRYSFAAGYYAQASNDGAFVWSDNSDFSGVHFSSTADNQFSVRAAGGVRFVTSGGGMTLDGQTIVANNQSSVTLNGAFGGTFSGTSSGTFNGNGAGLTLNAANITSGTLADARLSGNVALLNTSPTFAGDITMSGGAAYHHLALSGGNSTGYIYGSYPAFGDGIHMGYNYYADANGFPHVPDIGGGTSRITATFGEIILAVGGVDAAPSSVRLDATTTGVTVMGSFVNDSDRNVKQDFAPVNSSQILDEVLRLPVSEWSYKVDPKTRHIGPVAQDFYSVFNIGADDRHIAPIDEGGLAFAAIQALNQKLEEQRAENAELKQRLEALEKIILDRKSN